MGGRIHRLAPERKGRESNPQGSGTARRVVAPAVQVGPVSGRVALPYLWFQWAMQGSNLGGNPPGSLQRVILALWPAELTAHLFQHPDQDSNPGLLVRTEV